MRPQEEKRIYDWDAVTVGHESPSMEFHVTKGVIADYCTAIGNDNPIYRDEASVRAAGFLTIPSPPTMVHRYAPPQPTPKLFEDLFEQLRWELLQLVNHSF